MLLHVVKETDNGIVVRGAKYETAAAYSNQAFTKPTIANWGNSELSDYAVGFVLDMGAPGLKYISRNGFAGRAPSADYPLANRVDEIESLVVFDNVEIPWEDVLFYRHTRAATFIRSTLHRYSAFPFVQRTLHLADLMIGSALWNVKQSGLEKQQAVQEKLAQLACYRETINAHLTAAISLAEPSPGGLLMPNQSLLYTGRVTALSQLPAMMHIARELCGGQICITPDAATFADPRRRAVAGEVLLHQRQLGGRRPSQAPRVRPRPAQQRLRGTSPDVPALRPVAAFRAARRRLPQLRLRRSARAGQGRSGTVGQRRRRCGMTTHTRIRPFNTRDTYPEQNLDNDLAQAVVAGGVVYLRGQIGQDLDTRESVGIGDVEAQAEKAMANIAMLLKESGSRLEDVVKVTIYLVDVRYRETVYRVVGRWLKGVHPVSTGIVVDALARPEWLVEIDATAVISS